MGQDFYLSTGLSTGYLDVLFIQNNSTGTGTINYDYIPTAGQIWKVAKIIMAGNPSGATPQYMYVYSMNATFNAPLYGISYASTPTSLIVGDYNYPITTGSGAFIPFPGGTAVIGSQVFDNTFYITSTQYLRLTWNFTTNLSYSYHITLLRVK